MAALNRDDDAIDVLDLSDVPRARRHARAIADGAGLNRVESESFVLAVVELATNLARYARGGRILLSRVACDGASGVQVESEDSGPGIADIGRALEEGFSTGGGLGAGLPGVRRLTDDFELTSTAQGTKIVARKWASRR